MEGLRVRWTTASKEKNVIDFGKAEINLKLGIKIKEKICKF